MANRQSIQRDATRFADWILREIGRELRVARLIAGQRLADVAEILGTSISHVSRVEHGLIKGIGIPALTRHSAVVGLKPYMRLYPSVSRPLDRAQLALIARFRERLADSWQVLLEAPMPIAGDLRAADALIAIPECRCMVEVITRLADVQAQLRSARVKQRDLEADRLIFVVGGTTTNRRAIRDAGAVLADAFPLSTKDALLRLGAGVDPGANALILL
ncbi:MAG: helix-turn-helix domain-containing protein [Chloroflexota bacterium]|nr:helix-turn-helix domain-containing protein [Chloroflexota bacterium]